MKNLLLTLLLAISAGMYGQNTVIDISPETASSIAGSVIVIGASAADERDYLDVLNDGHTAAWYDYTDLTTITEVNDSVSVWKDKLLTTSLGEEAVAHSSNEISKTVIAASRSATEKSNEKAHGGSYSSKVVHSAVTGIHYLRVNYSVTIGIAYEVSVWVYLPSGQAGVASITLASGGVAPAFVSTSVKDQWVELSGTFTPGYADFSLAQDRHLLLLLPCFFQG